jgi:TM2 domain-containing membrane protein YozV
MRITFLTLIIVIEFNTFAHSNPGFKQQKFNSNLLTDSTLQKVDPWKNFYNRKNAGLAAMLSLAIPGAGQLYNGQYLKAGLFLGGETACLFGIYGLITNTIQPFGKSDVYINKDTNRALSIITFLWLGIRITSVIDAARSAVLINKEARLQNKQLSFETYQEKNITKVGLIYLF